MRSLRLIAAVAFIAGSFAVVTASASATTNSTGTLLGRLVVAPEHSAGL